MRQWHRKNRSTVPRVSSSQEMLTMILPRWENKSPLAMFGEQGCEPQPEAAVIRGALIEGASPEASDNQA